MHKLIGALLAMLPVSSLAAAQTRVDLELVLAVDVSDSMEPEEQALQRQGYVSALSHPDIVAAIRSGARGRIAVTYVEWSSPGRQHVIVPWMLIDGAEAAQAFARRLLGSPGRAMDSTSISSALAFSARLFRRNGFDGDRRAIDVSGDGPNNAGPPVAPVRDRIVRRGITINGLPIISRRGGFQIPDLQSYYRDCVVGGDGGFVIAVEGPGAFAEAIRRKLMLEIAARDPQLSLASLSAGEPKADCLVGEKLGGRAQ
jgi:hypothetical protein